MTKVLRATKDRMDGRMEKYNIHRRVGKIKAERRPKLAKLGGRISQRRNNKYEDENTSAVYVPCPPAVKNIDKVLKMMPDTKPMKARPAKLDDKVFNTLIPLFLTIS